MEKWMTSCLLLSSFLFCASSCSTSKQLKLLDISTVCSPVFDQRISTETYNTQIDFYHKHISGLMVFKKMDDTIEHVVFISETGFKFFDLEFSPNNFVVRYCLPGLNKKPVIETFRNDLGYLINKRFDRPIRVSQSDTSIAFKFQRLKHTYDFYSADIKCMKLERIERGNDTRKNLTMTLTKTGERNFETINIAHHNVKLNIFMKRIKQ